MKISRHLPQRPATGGLPAAAARPKMTLPLGLCAPSAAAERCVGKECSDPEYFDQENLGKDALLAAQRPPGGGWPVSWESHDVDIRT